jgi:NTE family protein
MARRVHLVLSSGGVRAFAYIGALRAMDEAHIEPATVSAVSAGAVIGALIADGKTGEELADLACGPAGDMSLLVGPQPGRLARLWALRRWPYAPRVENDFPGFVVRALGADKTFAELKRPFATMGVDIMAGDYLVYTRQTHPEMRVSEAVKIATAMPVVARPYLKGKRVVVDAAISTRSPVWLTAAVEDAQTRHLPIIVLRAAPRVAVKKPARIDLFAQRLIDATAVGRDLLFLKGNPRAHVVDLPTTAVAPYAFDLDAAARTTLVDVGYRTMADEIERVNGDFASVQPRKRDAGAHLPTSDDPSDEETAAWAGAHYAQRFEAGAPEVFISYARDDSVWLTALLSHLGRHANIKGAFSTWTDTAIEPGDDWAEEIRDAIGRARAAILLVSRAFKESEFIEQYEMPQIRQAAEKRRIPVMPVFVDDVDPGWMELEKWQGLNAPDEPLALIPENELESMLRQIAERVAERTAMA